MASHMNMSLKDIIEKGKRENKLKRIKRNTSKLSTFRKPNASKVNIGIEDARQKIISKKRNQITDAREKLTELAKKKDARLKLEQLRMKRGDAFHKQQHSLSQGYKKNVRPIKDRVFADSTRQVMSQPLTNSWKLSKHPIQINTRQIIERRQRSTKRYEELPLLKPIVRTIENNIDLVDDPMGEEYSPQQANPLNRKASLQLKITRKNDAYEGRSISQRTMATEEPRSPPRPQSILKKRPMAALKAEKPADKSEKPNHEFRIIVSNLRSTVTGADIEELFGDVGSMMESRLVRPGTAEVIYTTLEGAQRAVDLYHNRQLDGQPMNCLLVTPRSTASSSRNNSKPSLYSTNSNVEPDISTFHKVLFSNF